MSTTLPRATVAGFAVLPLATNGSGTLGVLLTLAPPATTGRTDLLLDVAGYFAATPAGTVVAYHAYLPNGVEATAFAQDSERMKFTGHERDLGDPSSPADDLDYMHARHYSMLTGRFLSVDSHAGRPKAPQSWNRYSYTRGNPLKYLDPTGDETELVFGHNDATNPLGHIAIAINGKVYSYGTNYTKGPQFVKDWGRSEKAYVEAQDKSRQTDRIQMKVTPEQEASLQQYLETHNPNAEGAVTYSKFGHSCVSVCETALEQGGILQGETGVEHLNGAGDQLQGSTGGGSIAPQEVVDEVNWAGLVVQTTSTGESPSVLVSLVGAVSHFFNF